MKHFGCCFIFVILLDVAQLNLGIEGGVITIGGGD